MGIVEEVALAILNSDRGAGGWPPLASRDNVPDSEGYVRNARAAIAKVLDCMEEPSEGVCAAGADVQTSALIIGPRPIFLAMLSAMRAEMGV